MANEKTRPNQVAFVMDQDMNRRFTAMTSPGGMLDPFGISGDRAGYLRFLLNRGMDSVEREYIERNKGDNKDNDDEDNGANENTPAETETAPNTNNKIENPA